MPALSIAGVSHSYGPRRALIDVSFDVAPASFTALLGLNGAGKSTLFSLVTRLFGIQNGRIGIFGHDIGQAPGEALRLLGVVFQPRTLDLDLSVTQNLLYHAALHGIARSEARLRSDEVLTRIGLADRAGSKVRDLSGGQMRRLEIARALLHRPRLLLLDEATVGLDVKARADILSHVRQLVTEQGIGVLWATHLFDEILPSDDLVVLHQGRVLAQGQVARVLEDAGSRQRQHRFHAPDRHRRETREPRAMSSTSLTPTRSGFSFAEYLTCLNGIVWREALRFLHQRERFVSALVRPLVWLFIFAAGFRQVLGISIIPPYETYILYEVYIAPGLMAMIQLFNGMQSSLSMVYDREMGNMRTLAGEPAAALVSAVLQAAGGNRGLAAAGLRLPADRLVLGYRAAADRLSHGAAGADPVGPDARRARHADLLRHQAAGEFCRRDELCHFSDVLCFLCALSAVAGAGRQPDALLCLPVQSVHPCGRTDPLCAVRTDQLDLACGRRRLHGGLHDRRDLCLRSIARPDPPRPRRRREHELAYLRSPHCLALTASSEFCVAADPRYPDWPCAQAKVPEISLAAVWAGPPLDDVAGQMEGRRQGQRAGIETGGKADPARGSAEGDHGISGRLGRTRPRQASCCSPACSMRSMPSALRS